MVSVTFTASGKFLDLTCLLTKHWQSTFLTLPQAWTCWTSLTQSHGPVRPLHSCPMEVYTEVSRAPCYMCFILLSLHTKTNRYQWYQLLYPCVYFLNPLEFTNASIETFAPFSVEQTASGVNRFSSCVLYHEVIQLLCWRNTGYIMLCICLSYQ